MKTLKRYIKTNDLWYLAMCIVCSTLSVLVLLSIGQYRYGGIINQQSNIISTLLSSGFRDAFVQAGASLAGIVAAVMLSCIDYRSLVNFWPVHVVLMWGLVLTTFIRNGTFGYSPGTTGNYSWIKIVSGLTIQPTELAKISFILTFAMHIDNVHGRINRPATLLRLLAHMCVPVLIVHFQGDDGTAIVFAAIGCMMLFAGGLSLKVIMGAITLAAVGVPVLIISGKLKGYQIDRILALFNPDNPDYSKILYQQNMGRIAIGAGQISGRGLFQPEHYYVPRSENDFIFSYLAEAFGFLGTIAVIGLLFAIAIKTLTTAMRAQDRVGSYICVGVFATLTWQIIINIGMNLTVLPVIGVTLPFFSAGGTSSLMLYLCVGLVLSVYSHNRKSLFD